MWRLCRKFPSAISTLWLLSHVGSIPRRNWFLWEACTAGEAKLPPALRCPPACLLLSAPLPSPEGFLCTGGFGASGRGGQGAPLHSFTLHSSLFSSFSWKRGLAVDWEVSLVRILTVLCDDLLCRKSSTFRLLKFEEVLEIKGYACTGRGRFSCSRKPGFQDYFSLWALQIWFNTQIWAIPFL